MVKKQVTMRTIDDITRPVQKRSRWQRLVRNFRKYRALQVAGVIVVVVVVVVVSIGVSRVFHRPDQNSLKTVTAEVSKHLILPKETPILATVTDKSSLKTPFLKEADNGDKILIYEKAKRVIIYRPSVDRIVDIGPVELSNIPKANQ